MTLFNTFKKPNAFMSRYLTFVHAAGIENSVFD